METDAFMGLMLITKIRNLLVYTEAIVKRIELSDEEFLMFSSI